MDIARLTDDQAAQAVYDHLLERLKTVPDVEYLANPVPHVWSLTRYGNMLVATRGTEDGWLLRVELRWKHRDDGTDPPTQQKVYRATDPARLRLVLVGNGEQEGSPDELLDSIIAMFVEQTGH